ncbi:MAG: class I adenylate-forming enzyme family protein [Actinomycetota bacterium]
MPDLLSIYAQMQPTKPAVIDDRPNGAITEWNFTQLEEAANRLANVMLQLGLQPGVDKVVWCGQNSPHVVAIICAARKIGLTAVPLNYRLTDDEAAYVIEHSDAVLVFIDSELAELVARIRTRIAKVKNVLVFAGPAPTGMQSSDELMASAASTPPTLPLAEDASSTMIYTSGTTGKPKGAMRKNLGNPEQSAALAALIGYTPNDIYIPTGPLYHSGPLGFLSVALAFGQTTVIQRKFEAEDWLRLVAKHKVTSTFSAPTPIRMVCSLPEHIKKKYDVSSMKRMIANAAPWSMALKQLYLANFPHDSLFEVYGSTELGINCVLLPADQLRKPGSCGQPSPMVEIKLFDDDGNEVTGVGPEHPGELYVKSPSVFDDYYKQHDKYMADNRYGYQTVGDIAYRDSEGYLYICDRKKDMIISGGMNIYPAEIEAALELHADIYEAAVFGIPSEEWGESVHAVVVARPGAQLDDATVLAHARAHLAGYKVPRSLSWMGELPKTGSGKILKRDLRAPFWSGRASQI